jgi:hypothetical protein
MGKDKKGLSKLMFMLSVVALILAGIVSITQYTLWLAGTQWILISILLAVYGTYMNGCDCECCENKNS